MKMREFVMGIAGTLYIVYNTGVDYNMYEIIILCFWALNKPVKSDKMFICIQFLWKKIIKSSNSAPQ